jgi:hypothetical protein
MNRLESLLTIAVVASVGLALSPTMARAQATTIHACYLNNPTGQLRRVGDATDCKSNETAISWSIQGSMGPQGPKGDPGAPGETGPQGPPATVAAPLVLNGAGTVITGNSTDGTGVQGQGTIGIYGIGTNLAGKFDGAVHVTGNLNATTIGASGVDVVGSTHTAVLGITNNTVDSASGVLGRATDTSGIKFGVRGLSSSPNGQGVQGINDAVNGGDAIGGFSLSSNGFASGVIGLTKGRGWGVKGVNENLVEGVGVEGVAATVGIRGQALTCGISSCTGTSGDAAQLVAGDGGHFLRGFVVNPNGTWTQKFRIDATGTGYFAGALHTQGGQDFAESVAVAKDLTLYTPGDLLVIDANADRQFGVTSEPYSTLVAGIYSTQPGILASTPKLAKDAKDEVPLAIVGIVPLKVSAENGPIHRGDLLVSSSKPGYAMKGTDRIRMLGAVVAKAMEPLQEGEGVIQVLVTLQ